MLSFFRGNQIFIAIPLALYVVLLHSGAMTGAIQPGIQNLETGLLYQSWFGWMAEYQRLSAGVAALLVFFQAILINFFVDEFRLMGDRNWFPGLFYALCASSLPDYLFVSAPLVAATFLPFSLWRIFSAFQKPHVTGAIFDGAFWIAVASLFYPGALWLLIAAFASIEIMRVFRFRERLVFLTGALTPLLLVWLWYFWVDQGAEFRNIQWGSLWQIYRFDNFGDLQALLKMAFIGFMALILLFGSGALLGRKGIQIQKYMYALYWFLLIAGLIILLQSTWHWEILILSSVPLGILFAMEFQDKRKRFWAELWHWVILALLFFIQFSTFFLKLFDTDF